MINKLSIDSGIYRLLDANADRAAEGLRVVGDIARFILNDATSSEQLRSLRSRHWQILSSVPNLLDQATSQRDSIGDVGRNYQSLKHEDLFSLTRCNFHRVQESFRTIEESLRTLCPNLVHEYSQLRYKCYDLEPIVLEKLKNWSIRQKLDFHLYVVLGNEFSKGRNFVEVTKQAIAGGAGAIQLRDKALSARELLPWAKELRHLTREHGVTLIINDHIELALAVNADGIHLGQEDFPIAEARAILGPHFIIGASTHNLEEAKQAVNDGATYINIGPLFSTNTKQGVVAAVGPDLITEITSQIDHPFTVMGGIKLHNVDQALQRGARRIAVVTAVVAEDDIQAAAQQFTDKIQSYVK